MGGLHLPVQHDPVAGGHRVRRVHGGRPARRPPGRRPPARRCGGAAGAGRPGGRAGDRSARPDLTRAGTVPDPHPGRVAQLVRALPSHGRGQGFESLRAHQIRRGQPLPRSAMIRRAVLVCLAVLALGRGWLRAAHRAQRRRAAAVPGPDLHRGGQDQRHHLPHRGQPAGRPRDPPARRLPPGGRCRRPAAPRGLRPRRQLLEREPHLGRRSWTRRPRSLAGATSRHRSATDSHRAGAPRRVRPPSA